MPGRQPNGWRSAPLTATTKTWCSPARTAHPSPPDHVYKTFKRLVRRHGLRDIPLHHLRHGSASLQIEAGVDIAVVSKRLGHSKISLTSDLIGTVGKSAAEAAAAVVPRAVAK